MKLTRLAFPTFAVAAAAAFLIPTDSQAFLLGIGGPLGLAQRDFRIFNNFTDASANNNTNPHPQFPGYTGAPMAIWKGTIEWGSELHGDGQGDPHQSGGLGSGGANYDASFQGLATQVGDTNSNTHSEILAQDNSTLAYTELPVSNGWRIRYISSWSWADGPGTGVSGIDLQGVACHEHGHALGLGHTNVAGATMFPSISGAGVAQRSIAPTDINNVQGLYGAAANDKPRITGLSLSLGVLTISGSNFDGGSTNEVWFTQSGSGGNGTPVKAFNVASTGGGTTIAVSVPGGAGSGDVLVRRNGNGGDDLSNAFPFDITAGPTCTPNNFCIAEPNSVGPGAFMNYVGSTSIGDNNFQLFVNGLPPGGLGLWYTGNADTFVPFGNGWNCIGGQVLRFSPSNADVFGTVSRQIDFNTYPGNQMASDGTEWKFQFWYRNPAGGGAFFNTSDGVTTIWCP